MRFAFVILLLSATLASPANAQTSKPFLARLSADKVNFPDAGPRQITFKLPILKDMLGAKPEEITSGKIYSLDSDRPPVDAWKKDLAAQNIDRSHFQWITQYLGGSQVALFSLSNGRVQRIGFFYHDLRPATATGMFHQFARLDSGGHVTDTDFEISLQNIGVAGYLEGDHTYQMQDPEHHDAPNMGTRTNAEATYHSEHFSSMFVVGIDYQDWYILHNNVPDERAKAIKQGVLLQGMTPIEAGLAMRDYGLPAGQFDQNYQNGKMEWRGKKKAATGYALIHDLWEESIRPHFGAGGKVIVHAEFKEGAVLTHDGD